MKTNLTALFILILLFSGFIASAQSIDESRFVNQILDDFHTPVIVPGGNGVFSLSVNNPDPINLTGDMTYVSLNISIYQYATLEESRMVSDIANPPQIIEADQAVEYQIENLTISPGNQYDLIFTISTQTGTPHGSYFSQSTYFVRFWLEFEYEGVNYTMVSRGYFNDEQWHNLTETESGPGDVNQTYLRELGFDGIIPDSSFSVKQPIPIWPFYLLIGITAFVGILATCLYILDNPGKYPKFERKLLRINGWLIQLRRTSFRRNKTR
jgi:hypothetical protein